MKPLSMFIKRIFLLLLFLGLPGAFAGTTTPDDSGIIGEITGWIDGNTCTFLSEPPYNEIYHVRLWLVDAPKGGQSNYLDFMGYIQKNTFYSSGEKRVELKIIANEPGGPENNNNVVGILTKLGHPSSCQQEFWESGYCGFNEGDVKMNEGETEEFREIYEKIQKEKQDLEQSKNAKQPVEIDYKEFRAAVNKGDVAEVKRLLDAGADANAQAVDKWGSKSTVLIEAATRGHLEIVELLVGHRANVNAVDNDGPRGYKNTALTRAAENRHSDVVKFLVEHGADVNAQRTDGYTALFFAVEKGLDLKTIKLLIDKGADPNVKVKRSGYYISLLDKAKNGGRGDLEYRRALVDLFRKYKCVDTEELEKWAKKLEAPEAKQRAKEQQARDDGVLVPGFGNTTPRKDALKGTLIDFSHPKRGSGLTDPTTRSRTSEEKRRYGDGEYIKEQFAEALGLLADRSSWAIGNIKSHHPYSPTTLYTTSIYIENKDKNVFEPTKEAAACRTEKESRIDYWLCFYEGEFGVPEEGDYRFVGQAYGAMLVGVDLLTGKKTETVLYAFDPKSEKGYGSAVKSREGWEICGNLYKGTWLHLVPGKRYPVKIAFGTADSSGNFQVKLGIQKMDRDDDKNFPLFTLEKVTSSKGGRPKTGPYNTSCVFAPPQK